MAPWMPLWVLYTTLPVRALSLIEPPWDSRWVVHEIVNIPANSSVTPMRPRLASVIMA